MNLLPDIQITQVSNGAAAGTSEVDSSILDMSGYDGVMFVASLATVVDACVLTLTPQDNTLNQTGGMTAITGITAPTFTASTSSNTLMVVDVYRPQSRYVRAAFTRTAQNATLNNIVAIQYKASKKPTTQGTTVLASAFGPASS
jgi:hypothetical protein